MKNITCILIITLYIATNNINAQFNKEIDSLFYKKCDTMTRKQFNKKLKSAIKLMSIGKDVSFQEIIEIVKISMSLPWKNYADQSKKNKQYLDLYSQTYLAKACEMLGSTPLKGIVAYSKKWGLFLSRPLNLNEMPCYNYYVIK